MTHEDYLASLEWIKIKKPDHALLNTLKQGYSRLNCLYMEQALKSVPERRQKAPAKKPSDDTTLVQLQKEKKSLYGRRAKLSNKFHELSTDPDRANISDEIQDIQRAIEKINLRIRHYEETGEWEDEPGEESGDDLPTNGVQLMKKLNSIRVLISNAKRELERLAAKPDSDQKKERIELVEHRLYELKNKENRVKTLVAQESI